MKKKEGLIMEKRVEKKHIWLFVTAFMLLSVIFAAPKAVYAAGHNLSTATNMAIGSTVTGDADGSHDYYKFSLSCNSMICFDAKTGGHDQRATFTIRNRNGDSLCWFGTSDPNNWGFQSCKEYVALNSGTYFIEVEGSIFTGDHYTLKTRVIAKNSSSVKIAGYNNCYLSKAVSVSMGNKIYSASRGMHYYRFSLSCRQTIRFVVQAVDSGMSIYCNLYDSSGNRLDTIASRVMKNKKITYTKTLSKGTYFIGVSHGILSDYYGRYIIQTTSLTKPNVPVSKSSQVISASSFKKYVGNAAFYVNARLTKGNGKLSYASSNKAVATINSKGKVTIKGEGKTTITITAAETSKYKKTSKKITVTVYPGTTVRIKISTGASGGQKMKISASCSTGEKVKWKSSNTNVAYVSGGYVVAKKAGTAVLTAYVNRNGKTYSARKTVTVKESVKYGNWSSWSFNPQSSTANKQVKTATFYRYYCFLCPVCGGREPFQGMSDCHQYSLSMSNGQVTWSTVPYQSCNSAVYSYSSAKRYTFSLGDGKRWNFSSGNLWDTAPGTKDASGPDAVVIKTGYQSRNVYRNCYISSVK